MSFWQVVVAELVGADDPWTGQSRVPLLAKRIGVSRQAVHGWLAGARPRAEHRKQLAALLETRAPRIRKSVILDIVNAAARELT